jgi:hypothetical protein
LVVRAVVVVVVVTLEPSPRPPTVNADKGVPSRARSISKLDFMMKVVCKMEGIEK